MMRLLRICSELSIRLSLSFTDVFLEFIDPMLNLLFHGQSFWGNPGRNSFVNKSVQQMGDEIDPVWASILASKGSMVRGCSWSV